MNNIEKMLRIGDLRTVGKSDEVVEMVLASSRLFQDVVHAILSDNPGIRMRASDAVEKISRFHPEWLKPYKRMFLHKIADIDQQEVRWHTAQILPRLNLTAIERKRVFALLVSYLDDNSRIVKTFSMQALADIALQDTAYIDEVRDIVSRSIKTGSPAMKARGKKLLSKLKEIET